jgi:hypothetical protein
VSEVFAVISMICRFNEWLQYLLRSRVRVFWIPMMKRYNLRSRAPPSILTFFLHHVHELTWVGQRLIRNSWNIKRYSDELVFFKSSFLRDRVQLDLIYYCFDKEVSRKSTVHTTLRKKAV